MCVCGCGCVRVHMHMCVRLCVCGALHTCEYIWENGIVLMCRESSKLTTTHFDQLYAINTFLHLTKPRTHSCEIHHLHYLP